MLDDLMEYLNPTTIVITLVGYIFCMAVLWKFNVGTWTMQSKIIISILALPIIYFVVAIQTNR
jgi:hypothetical protein